MLRLEGTNKNINAASVWVVLLLAWWTWSLVETICLWMGRGVYMTAGWYCQQRPPHLPPLRGREGKHEILNFTSNYGFTQLTQGLKVFVINKAVIQHGYLFRLFPPSSPPFLQSRYCTNLQLPNSVQKAASHIAEKAVQLDLAPGWVSPTTFI